MIAAEATDSDGYLGRDQVVLDVFSPTVEFTSPADDVTAQPGASLDVTWTWNGPADITGTLALAPIVEASAEPTGSDGAITDHTTTIVPIAVTSNVSVADLVVSLRADHTYLWDLTVSLVSSSGPQPHCHRPPSPSPAWGGCIPGSSWRLARGCPARCSG